MAFSALLGAATATMNAAKNTALHIKGQLRKKKYVGDLHIDAVTQHSQGSVSRHGATKRRIKQGRQSTLLYSKFLAKCMKEEPEKSWDWVNMLPRFFAMSSGGHLLGEIICLDRELESLDRDLNSLLGLQSIASANDTVRIGFLFQTFQMFIPITEAGPDFVRQARGFMQMMDRQE